MRIVSQDGKYDVPYKRIVLEVSGQHLYADFLYDEDAYREIGTYKTKERCLEVMQEIQRKYNCGAKVCELPKE